MPVEQALAVLAAVRGEQIVVASMGAAREWPRLSQHPLDFQYLPSAMGQGPLLGLGLALAQPQREVIVLNGDGSLLMNLGCLVTIAAARAANYTLVVLDNGIYEVTGGQTTAGSVAHVDFAALARGAGWTNVIAPRDVEDFRLALPGCLSQPGPRFIALAVQPTAGDHQLPKPASIPSRCAALRERLATSD
ncbi:MAG: thiamine pyrophosphate-binding protein [Planctomycetes bacterium]|nr:thiamine pyrophosphate-binding protein [Planctomycetota bacterium]